MTTRHITERYRLPREPERTWPATVRLRRLLGLLLVLVGSIWLGLGLTGLVIDIPLPMEWVRELVIAWSS